MTGLSCARNGAACSEFSTALNQIYLQLNGDLSHRLLSTCGERPASRYVFPRFGARSKLFTVTGALA